MTQNLDFNKLVPSSLKNETLTSLVSNLFNRFVSEEKSVSINGRIGKSVPGDPNIQQSSLDRELNSLTPALYFKTGTEENVFTFEDIVNKLGVLNTDLDNMRSWMKEQSFNYSLPIDYDKLINYANYFWVGAALKNKPLVQWNPTLDPEYYVISKPNKNDLIKMPVRLATTRPVNLYANDRPPETFKIFFTSNNTFTVTSDLLDNTGNPVVIKQSTNTLYSLVPGEKTFVSLFSSDTNLPESPILGTDKYGVDDPDFIDDRLCSFSIVNGANTFTAGDYFILTITYFTSKIYITPFSSNLIGKGSINGVRTTSSLMYLDGVRLRGGERVLVKNQIDHSENGIYIVSIRNKWQRAVDANTPESLKQDSLVYVELGIKNAGISFKLNRYANLPEDNLVFNILSITAEKPINQWQEFNYWFHRDDLEEQGFSIDLSLQATRPIIEYNNQLKLNSKIDNEGNPADTGIDYKQVKTRLNQIPQFDLFRYDGTHHGSTSGIFYYVEDPDFSVDLVLQRRVKTTQNYDYVFGTGLQDSQGRLLYYKLDGKLKSLWRPGVSFPSATTPIFNSTSDKGNLVIQSISFNADNQDWVFTAKNSTRFNVSGSRSGDVGLAIVGIPFTHEELQITIFNGTVSFSSGDKFTFSVNAPLSPRYVKKNLDDTIINYPGGVSGDRLDATIDGTWLTPLRMFQNLERETRSEIALGDLMEHMRGVIRNQDGFIGTSFGNNNVRLLDLNDGIGGNIREFSSNFPLLLSMLIQKDVSPLTMIDFAEQQYNIALSSIDQFMIDELANYIATNGTLVSSIINSFAPDIQALADYFELLRAENQTLKEVFSDSTAGVKNWPVTLPMIGLLPKTKPTIGFDHELGIETIVHHDGHISLLTTRNPQFDRTFVKTSVLRSDGTTSTGIFSETVPTSPYARQLWLKSSTFELKIFNVDYDTNIDPGLGAIGQYWYNRLTNQLFEWNVAASVWIISTSSIASRWTLVDTSAIRNSLVLAIENRLYDSVHPAQQLNLNLGLASNSQYAETELAKFSAKYNLDTYAPDYLGSDAYTWNYSGAIIPSLGTVPARWFDVYKKYFDIPGISLPTCRPNIEPWKLLNFATKPTYWDATYSVSNLGSADIIPPVKVVSLSNIPVLFGLLVIDGVQLVSGDRILLVNQTLQQFNGVYIVSNGGWIRASDVLNNQTTVSVSEGYNWAGTKWSINTLNPINLGLTNIIFEQVRIWKQQMWDDIKAARPNLKLCVNVNTDNLIPPYVSSTKFESLEALTTTIPNTASNGYLFGDNGPVELAWKKSLEYVYGLSRSYFRLAPLQFLDKSWGETYMSADDNVRVERNIMRPLPSAKFLFHGEKLNIVNVYSDTEAQQRFKILPGGSISWVGKALVQFEVTHCADNLTVFHLKINDTLVGMITEGISFTTPTVNGVTFSNVVIDDLGIPFELGEKFVINFYDDIVDPNYIAPVIPNLELGCEGCVVDGTPTIINNVPMIRVNATYSHLPATSKKFKGTGQWFTNLLRYSYIDTDVSQAALAYRGWELKLAHRVGSLIRQDSLNIETILGNLPPTSYSVILKRSINTESKWISALRIQLVQMGSRIRNAENLYIPSTDASDWIFRVEVYNPQYPFAEYYVLDTAGSSMTFNALSKRSTELAWKRYTDKVSLQTATMPSTITGLQNVINFVYGYVDRLNDLGWTINEDDTPITDEETGRNLDWQLEVEKLVDRVYSGISAGEGHILNPFIKKLVLQTPIGLMSRFTESNFIDSYSTQAAFDVIGTVIPISQLTVIRTDDNAIVNSTTPIFSAHVFIDEFEHAILMNKKFSDEFNAPTIFDPFLGLRIDSAYLSFIRQDDITRKPTFNGFFLSGNDVKRNIVSSVDNIGHFYDASQTFSEQKTADHALALLGFTRKDYFSNIGITDNTQFNFWRGLIQAKGTNMTIDAFVNYKKFSDASVDEYWSYKVAEYGDARERTFPEIKINPNDVTQKFARIQFYSASDTQYEALPLYTQIENSDNNRWFSIDDLGTGMKFDAQKIEETVISDGPCYIRLNNIFHNGDSMGPIVSGPTGATVIGASLIKVTQAGTYTVSGYTWLNPTKLSPIKLFDYQENVLVDEIGLWHPAIGIHASAPLEVVDIVNKEDPAYYNYTTQTLSNPNYRHLKPWAEKEVGKVWWDISNLAYIPYYDATIFPNRDTRHSRWGALAEWASVDLYEWTSSNVHPSEYDALAANQEGSSEIDRSIRASGKVALQKYYTRSRIIKTRPIAWSEAGVGNGNAHPSFGSPAFVKVFVSGDRLIPDTGRLEESGLTNGKNFGGWVGTKPVGEVSIGTEISYAIGSKTDTNLSYLISNDSSISSINISPIAKGNLGSYIGEIKILLHTITAASPAITTPEVPATYSPAIPATYSPAIPATPGSPAIPAIPAVYQWLAPPNTAVLQQLFSQNGTGTTTQIISCSVVGGSGSNGSFSVNITSGTGNNQGTVVSLGNISGTGYQVGDVLVGYAAGSPIVQITIGAQIIISAAVPAVPEVPSTPYIPPAELTPYIPAVLLTPYVPATTTPATAGVYSIRLMDTDGFYEDSIIDDWTSVDLESDSQRTYSFDKFGLALTITRNLVGTINAFTIASSVTNPLNDVYIREAINFTEIIPLPDNIFINDTSDPDYTIYEYEWRSWNVPSQSALNADLVAPRNTWKPYLGDEVVVSASAGVVAAMKSLGNSVTLKNGIKINRFNSMWTEWSALQQYRVETISDGVSNVKFIFADNIDGNRLSIYSNGIQLNPAGYVITGNIVQVVNILAEGTAIMALYRAYQPTAAELSFNPEIDDDVSIQIQYKRDYQFTTVDVRDELGNISSTKYYFWVQDKTIPQIDKNMSLTQAKTILKNGPSSYTIFSKLIGTPTIQHPFAAAYDSCAISGLNSLVSKNDSYKLRFLRDFTLRDDPEELSLKNIHTEWSLIRKQQKSKIPKSLWDILTDAVSGEDAGGRQLPSQVRVDYDLRNGTRSRFGFKPGQIFVDTALARASITNVILNTSLTINLVNKTITDYINALDFNNSEEWFADANKARITMNLIWNTARASQINEIFFGVLEDALSNNYEFSDIFKTSFITVSSSTVIQESNQSEQIDDQY